MYLLVSPQILVKRSRIIISTRMKPRSKAVIFIFIVMIYVVRFIARLTDCMQLINKRARGITELALLYFCVTYLILCYL